MKTAVIVSKLDPAGLNIAKQLEQFFLPKNASLHFIEEKQIFADSVNEIDADCFVFASKHASASGKKSLTVHAIGNWGNAELGGRDRTLVNTSAFLMKHYFNALRQYQQQLSLSDYSVSLEATHHGPYVEEKPCVFIELGSSEKEWSNSIGALAVAKSIAHHTQSDGNFIPCLAVGGSHYLSRFYDLESKTHYAVGHAIPEYALKELNEPMLHKALNAFVEKNLVVVFDEKGLGTEQDRVMKLLHASGANVKSVSEAMKEK